MLRVAMITDHSDSDNIVDGGVQAVTKYLIDGLLRSNKVALHVLSFKYGISKGRTSEAAGYIRHVLPGARLGTLTAFRNDQKVLNSYLSTIKPQIVHGQGAGHNGILASRSRFPSVITIHGIMEEEAKYMGGLAARMRHWALSRISEHHCIARGKHTILISPYVDEYFRNRLAGNRYLISNPVANEFFAITRRESTNRILFAGRLLPLKGVVDLIRAASTVAKSQPIELILAGSLDEKEYVTLLRNEARRLKVEGVVHFRGILNEQELRDEFARAALLALPSYQETAPMVVAEAMACGVPVIASDIGGVRYQVMDGETGYLVVPGDINTLSRRIEELLSNASLRESFGRAARGFAAENYGADSVAAKTIDVYRNVLAEKLGNYYEN